VWSSSMEEGKVITVVVTATPGVTDSVVIPVATTLVPTTEQATSTTPAPTSIVVSISPTREVTPRVTDEPTPMVGKENKLLILAEPGVLGYTLQTLENLQNESAVDMSSPNNQFVLVSESGTALMPEGGYIMFTSNHGLLDFVIPTGSYLVELLEQSSREWIVVAKGLDWNPEIDNSIFVNFSGYDPGSNLVSIFNPAEGFGESFSLIYTVDQARNSLANNCGGGCDEAWIYIFDVNTGEYVIAEYIGNDLFIRDRGILAVTTSQ